MEVAIVGLAACVTLGEDGKLVEDARLAVCSVGPVSKRLHQIENVLKGQEISESLLDEAGDMLLKHIEPIDDVRASQKYRSTVAPRILKQAIRCCAQNVSG